MWKTGRKCSGLSILYALLKNVILFSLKYINFFRGRTMVKELMGMKVSFNIFLFCFLFYFMFIANFYILLFTYRVSQFKKKQKTYWNLAKP